MIFKPKQYLVTAFLLCLLSPGLAQIKKVVPVAPSHNKSFSRSLNTAVFTTKFVINDKHDISFVRCEPQDGALTFYSSDKFDSYESVAKVVGLGQLLKMDNTLSQILDLKPGYYAHRTKKGQPWVVEELKDKD